MGKYKWLIRHVFLPLGLDFAIGRTSTILQKLRTFWSELCWDAEKVKFIINMRK